MNCTAGTKEKVSGGEGAEMCRAQRGYTLIELMVTLAVLSILLLIAIPTYQDYAVRAKISEGVVGVGRFKVAVVDTFLTIGEWPTDNAAAGVLSPTQYRTDYVERVDVQGVPHGGSIQITFALPELGSDNTLIFTPTFVGGSFAWNCNQGTLPVRYRPPVCR
jgi:type IV pilus assembly protein PilA